MVVVPLSTLNEVDINLSLCYCWSFTSGNLTRSSRKLANFVFLRNFACSSFLLDHSSRIARPTPDATLCVPTPPYLTGLRWPNDIGWWWRSWCSYCLFPHVDISCVQRQYYKTAAYNILLTGSNPHAHATTTNIHWRYETSDEWEGVVSWARGTGQLRA